MQEKMGSATFRLDRATRERLQDLAARTRRSESEVLRLLVTSAPLPDRPDVRAGSRWWAATGAAGAAGQEVRRGGNGNP